MGAELPYMYTYVIYTFNPIRIWEDEVDKFPIFTVLFRAMIVALCWPYLAREGFLLANKHRAQFARSGSCQFKGGDLSETNHVSLA